MTAVDDPATVTALGPVIPVMRPWLGDEEAAAAAEAVRSGWVAQGPRVAEFEAAFAAPGRRRRTPWPCRRAPPRCTSRSSLAGVGPGDEVVVPSLSFIATANVVPLRRRDAGVRRRRPRHPEPDARHRRGGARPPRTRAVILVDQAGVPADIDAVRALCDPRGITVVEDAACAIGADLRPAQPVGARAELAAFSFHPRKVITTGEGGMLVDRRRRPRGAAAAAPRARHERERRRPARGTRPGARAVPRDRVQLPHDRHPGRRRARAARPSSTPSSPAAASSASRYRRLLGERAGPRRRGHGRRPALAAPPTTSRSGCCLPDGLPDRPRRPARPAGRRTASAPAAGIMAAHLEPAYADVGRARPAGDRAAHPHAR